MSTRSALPLLLAVTLAACGPETSYEAPLTVLVVLDEAPILSELERLTGRRDRSRDLPALEAYRARKVRRVLDGVLADLVDVELVRAFERLPIAVLRVASSEAMAALRSHPAVVSVELDAPHQAHLAESLPAISQPAVAASGDIGTGTTVAVLDTGANYTLSIFGSCTAPGVPATCKIALSQDFAPSDGLIDDATSHGTHVAAIVVGVAPGARVLALDVFSADGIAYSTHIVAAIDWVIANRATWNIAAINLSLGNSEFTAPCPTDVLAVAVASARTAGVLTAASTGNDGKVDRVATPACAPAALSVGATYDADVGGIAWETPCTDQTTAQDKVGCFSNSASFVSLLAPGAIITVAGASVGGTSMAAPHVAGALAVLRAAFPAESVDETAVRLTGSGVLVTDARNGVMTPRVDLAAAMENTPSGDTTPPTGTVSINAGATYSQSSAVTLTLSASDASGVASMCVSNTSTCTAFEAYATSKAWSLAAGGGTRTVYVRYKDAVGNASPAVTDTIYVDSAAPSSGVLTATAGSGQVALAWSGFTETASGIASYKIMASSTSTPPVSCTSGALVYSGSGTSTTHAGLVNGTLWRYRACAVDAAGNVSAGVIDSATPAGADTTPPTGSVTINGGAIATTTTVVTLALTGSDPSGVTQMCVTNTTSCAAWEPFGTSKAWTLTAGGGVKTVRVWLADGAGNVTVAALSDTIFFDSAAPTGGAVIATPGAGQVALSWSGFTDTGAGIASYKLMASSSATPAVSCTNATLLQSSAATGYTHAGLSSATWRYRVCAVDAAGNVSPGAIATAVVSGADATPPTGSVSVAAAAVAVNTSSVTLALAGSDASGVPSMCISNTASCTAWEAFATSKAWTLPAGAGVKTVYVRLQDGAGNVSALLSDAVFVDFAAPSTGTLSATPGAGQIALAWSGFNDTASGIASYKVMASQTTTPGPSCTSGALIFSGAGAAFTHTGLTAGAVWRYRACAVDWAGNVAAGAIATATAQ